MARPAAAVGLRVAILLSAPTFEGFFGRQLKLTAGDYVRVWRGGWVWSYCRMLRREGIDPAIYVASLAHSGRRETPEGFGVRFLPLRRWYGLWERFPVIRRSPPARYVAEVASGVALAPALLPALAEDRIDVLVVQEYWTGRYDYLSRAIEIPFIAAHQGLPGRRQLKFAKRRSLARAFAVTAQTRAEAEQVARFGVAARCIVNGVDSDLFAPSAAKRADGALIGPRDRPRIILCVARLAHEHKRQGDLIRALARLPEAWRLRLAGRGPDAESLVRLARSLGVHERVELLGFLTDDADLREQLQACDVFALVSRREGMPMALLEAMSCGAAVVGTDIPGIADVIEDGVSGVLVPVGDVARIAERIEHAYVRRAELGENARRVVERSYSERVVGPQLAEIIERAASTRADRSARTRPAGRPA